MPCIYEVRLTRAAEKDLKALRGLAARATEELLLLETDPERGHALAGSMRGCRALEFTLPGSGACRAVYVVVEEDRVCLVFIIGPHENIYREAERRVEALRRSGAV